MRQCRSAPFARLILSLVVVVLFAALPAGRIAAQGDPPAQPTAVTAPPVETVEPIDLEELRTLAAVVRSNAEDAARYASDASNFLSLFEAFSVVIAIAAASLGVVGVTRLFAAQSALTDARKRLLEELAGLRADFERQIEERERDLRALEDQLTKTLELQRRSAAQSTLALSLLPLGERQYKAQDYSGAAETYKRALKLDENNPLIHYRLGYVYVQNGQLEEAERHLIRALEIDPEFELARAALGYVYRRISDKQPEGLDHDLLMNRGEQFLLEALKAQPRLVDEDGESWWGSLGGLYRRRGQVDQAIHAYEQAAKVTPHSSYPFSNLALLYMGKHDRAEMLRTYKRVERLARGETQAEVDNYWAYADLLTSSLAMGKLEQAEEALTSVLDIAPTESDYTLTLLIDTLERLRVALGGSDSAPHIDHYIGRIREHLNRRAKS
ncbi:MAG: tetratricopeptide repeat protein [Anaerolineae bacterium]|nr:tetratricopeptide repeat protein [Anaerolineae bacterium]NUQ03651.1 tetratricopeptide repeat protein [Anaerolineae bacterium]